MRLEKINALEKHTNAFILNNIRHSHTGCLIRDKMHYLMPINRDLMSYFQMHCALQNKHSALTREHQRNILKPMHQEYYIMRYNSALCSIFIRVIHLKYQPILSLSHIYNRLLEPQVLAPTVIWYQGRGVYFPNKFLFFRTPFDHIPIFQEQVI